MKTEIFSHNEIIVLLAIDSNQKIFSKFGVNWKEIDSFTDMIDRSFLSLIEREEITQKLIKFNLIEKKINGFRSTKVFKKLKPFRLFISYPDFIDLYSKTINKHFNAN